MSRHVGVLRDAAGLREALRALSRLRDRAIAEGSIDLRNRAEAAVADRGRRISFAAKAGAAISARDFPASDPALARRSFITLDQALRVARGAVTAGGAHEPRPNSASLLVERSRARCAGGRSRPRRRHHLAGDHSRRGPAQKRSIAARQKPGVLAGLDLARKAFELVDPALRFEPAARDGDCFAPGAVLARIEGPARGILAGERVALNFLGRMCGIATLTSHYAEAVAHTNARHLLHPENHAGPARL